MGEPFRSGSRGERKWMRGAGWVHAGDVSAAAQFVLERQGGFSTSEVAGWFEVSNATLWRQVARGGATEDPPKGPHKTVPDSAVDELAELVRTFNLYGIGFTRPQTVALLGAVVVAGRKEDGVAAPCYRTLSDVLHRCNGRVSFKRSRNLADNEVVKMNFHRVAAHYAEMMEYLRKYPELACEAWRLGRAMRLRWRSLSSGAKISAATSGDGSRLPSLLCSSSKVPIDQLENCASMFAHDRTTFDGLDVATTKSGDFSDAVQYL